MTELATEEFLLRMNGNKNALRRERQHALAAAHLDNLYFVGDHGTGLYHAQKGWSYLCRGVWSGSWQIVSARQELTPFCERCLSVITYWSIGPDVWP